MFKLDLEKAEEPEIKLPTSAGSSKKQESFRKTSTSALLTTPKSDCMDHHKLWKILQEIGNTRPPDLPLEKSVCRSGSNSYNWTWNKRLIPNWERNTSTQGCILSPCLFNLYAVYIMWNVGLNEAQAGIKIAGRNINKLRYTDDTALLAEKEDLKSLWWKRKRRVKKLA